jgi:ankyrin repeat protein
LGEAAAPRDAGVMDNAAAKWQAYKQTMVVPATLWEAAKADDVLELARQLDAGSNINECDAHGYSPLMLAAYSGNHEAFEYLLERGADPNSVDATGNSVLMGAAFKGHASMVKRLLDVGANARARNHAGLDARNFAENFGRTEVVQLLNREVSS